jgi:hypothetical protein
VLFTTWSIWFYPYTHDNINKLEMVQRRAARYVQNNYHNTSSVTSMIDTLGWPTLAERRLKTRLIMLYKITHALIAIPNNILIPTDSRTSSAWNEPLAGPKFFFWASQILESLAQKFRFHLIAIYALGCFRNFSCTPVTVPKLPWRDPTPVRLVKEWILMLLIKTINLKTVYILISDVFFS